MPSESNAVVIINADAAGNCRVSDICGCVSTIRDSSGHLPLLNTPIRSWLMIPRCVSFFGARSSSLMQLILKSKTMMPKQNSGKVVALVLRH